MRPSRVPATSAIPSTDDDDGARDKGSKKKSGYVDAGVRGGVDVLVHRTFLGNAWDERGEFKGGFVAREGGDAAVGVNGAGGGQTSTAPSEDTGTTATVKAGGEREVRIELDVLGRKEYYSAREGCKYLSQILYSYILWWISWEYVAGNA